MLRKWFGKATITTITTLECNLLDTIRNGTIRDPAELGERLSALNKQIAATEAQWERLDTRADPSAFLAAPSVAERLRTLQAEAAALPAAIEAAQQRRDAFLALSRLFDAVSTDVATRTAVLLEHPAPDARECDAQLQALDQATRLLGHLAARLNIFSSAPQFRRVDDALKTLRDEYQRRTHACDLLRAPGMRQKLALPATMTELLDVVENRERKTA